MKAVICGELFDGTALTLKSDWTIFIDKEEIISSHPTSDCEIPLDAEVIDARAFTVIPGLIDCHDHIASFGYEIAGRWGITEQQTHRHMRIASTLQQTLQTGYTTIRDAGGLPAGFRDAINEDLIPGPRLLVSVGIISPTGGIAGHLSPSGHKTPFSDDPALPDGVANGPIEMRKKVREMIGAGADVIKFAATGGASSRMGLEPRDMLITKDEIEAIVDEAHKLGKKVMCHALGGPGLTASLEAGVDSIEHGTFLHEDPRNLQLMIQNNTFFTPTFAVYKYHFEKGTPHGRRRARELKTDHTKSLLAAMDHGVKIVAGTDAGGWVHGNNAEELVCLVEAGMSPSQAILAGTQTAAECIGLQEELGTLEKGRKADLLFVSQNPLEDISCLQFGEAISLVMKGGKVVSDKRHESL